MTALEVGYNTLVRDTVPTYRPRIGLHSFLTAVPRPGPFGFSFEPDGSTIDGYVRFADGTLILANAPVAGQQSTGAWAINDLNEFTGFWVDANGAQHGFVAVAVP